MAEGHTYGKRGVFGGGGGDYLVVRGRLASDPGALGS